MIRRSTCFKIWLHRNSTYFDNRRPCFGVGRISKVAKELGSSIRSFREGLKGDEEEKKEDTKPEDK